MKKLELKLPKTFTRLLGLLLFAASALVVADAERVAVIGHPGLPQADRAALVRLYAGHTIELDGKVVKVVNGAPGSSSRAHFLNSVLRMDEARYRAYWTVRRHVGKGVPPDELPSDAAVIEFVSNTPGGIGYVSIDSIVEGLNVIGRY